MDKAPTTPAEPSGLRLLVPPWCSGSWFLINVRMFFNDTWAHEKSLYRGQRAKESPPAGHRVKLQIFGSTFHTWKLLQSPVYSLQCEPSTCGSRDKECGWSFCLPQVTILGMSPPHGFYTCGDLHTYSVKLYSLAVSMGIASAGR